MAENKEHKLEREYVIPLRKAWLRVPNYERTGKAIKEIKKFLAKHMNVPERDTKKIKIDVYFNNELWFRGRRHPPSKVKVRAIKEGDLIRVQFVEEPEHVKFLKAKQEKVHKPAEKKAEKKPEVEDKKEEKTEEQKREEKEKEKAVAEQKGKEIKQEAKAEKHITKIDKHKTQPRRMALQK